MFKELNMSPGGFTHLQEIKDQAELRCLSRVGATLGCWLTVSGGGALSVRSPVETSLTVSVGGAGLPVTLGRLVFV